MSDFGFRITFRFSKKYWIFHFWISERSKCAKDEGPPASKISSTSYLYHVDFKVLFNCKFARSFWQTKFFGKFNLSTCQSFWINDGVRRVCIFVQTWILNAYTTGCSSSVLSKNRAYIGQLRTDMVTPKGSGWLCLLYPVIAFQCRIFYTHSSELENWWCIVMSRLQA